eukprot:4352132-Prorocentrum_lima.AAC.1
MGRSVLDAAVGLEDVACVIRGLLCLMVVSVLVGCAVSWVSCGSVGSICWGALGGSPVLGVGL